MLQNAFAALDPKWKTVLTHTAIWVGYFLLNNILAFATNLQAIIPWQLPFTLLLLAGLFYTNVHLVIEPCVQRNAYIRLVVLTVLLLALYVFLRYCLLVYLLPWLNISTIFSVGQMSGVSKFIPDSLWIAMQYLLLSYGYWFSRRAVRSERAKRHSEREMLTLVLEKNRAELAFLRAQLNPHFLYNTLNLFFADALKTSPRLAKGIMTLSQMLRSITDIGYDELVPISRELTYIRNYITIQEYRFSNQLNLKLSVEGEEFSDQVLLPPLLVLSLVENIFKYGDILDPTMAAVISVRITADELEIDTTNRKRTTPVHEPGGIGLNNIEKQLRLVFPGGVTLTRHETDNSFAVRLHIVLQP
jgi:two-component system, LytTR family, sensor kinase